MTPVIIQPRYLGDGVYASFDGYHINLHVGSHDAPPAVALEPFVLTALVQYRDAINEAYARLMRDAQDTGGDRGAGEGEAAK